MTDRIDDLISALKRARLDSFTEATVGDVVDAQQIEDACVAIDASADEANRRMMVYDEDEVRTILSDCMPTEYAIEQALKYIDDVFATVDR